MTSTKAAEEYINDNKSWKVPLDQSVELVESKLSVSVMPYDKKFVDVFYRHFKQIKVQPKATIILFHGMGSSSSLLAPLANALRNLPIDVVSFDMIGHGRSQGINNVQSFDETTQTFKPDCFLPDFRLLYSIGWRFTHQFICDVQGARLSNKPVFLYGHATGANTVVSMMLNQHAENPVCKQVKGIILENVAIDLTDAPTSNVVWALLYGVSAIAPTIPTSIYNSTSSNLNTAKFSNYSRIAAVAKWRLEHEECYHQSLPIATSREVVQMSAEIKEKLEKTSNAAVLDIPALLLHGTDDKVCNISGSAYLQKMNKNKDVKFVQYDKAVHNLLLDACVLEVLGDIKNWLNAQF